MRNVKYDPKGWIWSAKSYRKHIVKKRLAQLHRYRKKAGIPLDAPLSNRGRPRYYDDQGNILCSTT
jgi:hypothetical protein